MKVTIIEDELTVGDLWDFEEFAGMTVQEAFTPQYIYDPKGQRVLDAKGKPEKEVKLTGKSQVGLVWLALRHDNPEATIEDAKKVRISEIEFKPSEVEDNPKDEKS